MASIVFIALVLLGQASIAAGPDAGATVAAGSARADGVVLRHRRGEPVLRGRWGVVGRVQEGLDAALRGCGKPGLVADGKFGDGSHDALRRLGECAGVGEYQLRKGERFDGTVTEALWTRLRSDDALPDVRERAFTVWVTHEATDYDRLEFNFTAAGEPQPNDPTSYITWGPYGATAGHGREVQGILANPSTGARVSTCLGNEADTIRGLATATDVQVAGIVRAAYLDKDRRAVWKNGFACLADDRDVRRAYDAYAFETDRWFRPAVRRLYTLVATPTATDFAFFVDLAMHMDITRARTAAAKAAVERRTTELGRPLSSPERRREIGQALVEALSNQVEDRRGRNVVYYVDGLGEEALSPAERDAWKRRSGLKASDFGLTDDPYASL